MDFSGFDRFVTLGHSRFGAGSWAGELDCRSDLERSMLKYGLVFKISQ